MNFLQWLESREVPYTGQVWDRKGDWHLIEYPSWWAIRHEVDRTTYTGKRDYINKLWNDRGRPWNGNDGGNETGYRFSKFNLPR